MLQDDREANAGGERSGLPNRKSFSRHSPDVAYDARQFDRYWQFFKWVANSVAPTASPHDRVARGPPSISKMPATFVRRSSLKVSSRPLLMVSVPNSAAIASTGGFAAFIFVIVLDVERGPKRHGASTATPNPWSAQASARRALRRGRYLRPYQGRPGTCAFARLRHFRQIRWKPTETKCCRECSIIRRLRYPKPIG